MKKTNVFSHFKLILMTNKFIYRVLWFLACTFLVTSSLLTQQSIQIISWNLESGDSNIDSFGLAISGLQGVDIWGLSEVEDANALSSFKQYAAIGEDANYEGILGSTGGSDRLAVVYNADRFDMLSTEELHNINIGGDVRSPLLVLFQEKSSGFEFFFISFVLILSFSPYFKRGQLLVSRH